MDTNKFRAWIYARQGLEQTRVGSAREALAHAGWQRSVGGVNPYLALRARSGEGREQVDALAERLELLELPSARGCTYVLPAEHFALGLTIGRNFASVTKLATARKLGVPDAEIDALQSAVLAALATETLCPFNLKKALGDKVRSLGEEGKRKGLTTTLPVALGILQSQGRIRRKPINGRLDTQRYMYELWEPALIDFPTEEDAAEEIARLYFAWTGAATLKEFRDFTAFNVKAAQAACECAGLVPFTADPTLLALPETNRDFEAYTPPPTAAYSLVSNLDSFLLLRRGSSFWLDAEDRDLSVPTDKGEKPLSGLAELWSHAILDRGRLVGLWEFDPDAGCIAWAAWVPLTESLLDAVDAAERYVSNDLTDARSFSLDSPASRQPRLEVLRRIQKALHG